MSKYISLDTKNLDITDSEEEEWETEGSYENKDRISLQSVQTEVKVAKIENKYNTGQGYVGKQNKFLKKQTKPQYYKRNGNTNIFGKTGSKIYHGKSGDPYAYLNQIGGEEKKEQKEEEEEEVTQVKSGLNYPKNTTKKSSGGLNYPRNKSSSKTQQKQVQQEVKQEVKQEVVQEQQEEQQYEQEQQQEEQQQEEQQQEEQQQEEQQEEQQQEQEQEQEVQQEQPEIVLGQSFAQSLEPYQNSDPEYLSFEKDFVVRIDDVDPNGEWWFVSTEQGETGWVPSALFFVMQ